MKQVVRVKLMKTYYPYGALMKFVFDKTRRDGQMRADLFKCIERARRGGFFEETFEVFPPEQLERAKRVAAGEGYRLIIEYDDGSVEVIGHCV